jgi:hypothetical protein
MIPLSLNGKKTVVYLEITGISPKEVRENGDRLVKVG